MPGKLTIVVDSRAAILDRENCVLGQLLREEVSRDGSHVVFHFLNASGPGSATSLTAHTETYE